MVRAGRKRNSKWKRIGTAVVITAAVVILYPFLTDFYSRYEQTRLVEDAEVMLDSAQPAGGTEAGAPEDEAGRVRTNSRAITAWGHLEIPSIGVSTPVVAGTSPEMLAVAPGWYTDSALPGKGNTAIAGHLNVYGSHFRKLETLGAGDEIFLIYKDKVYVYEVETVTTIDSVSTITYPCGYNALTLTTCTTEGRDLRTAVRARLVSTGDIEG